MNYVTKPKALNIVVALSCEAKPLIDFYRLTKVTSKPFSIFKGYTENREVIINLLVTGIGGLNMAAGTAWLAAKSDHCSRVWLNVGSAGHKTADVGSIHRIYRSVDALSERSVYLPLVVKWSGDINALLTYSSPCSDYPENALVDMEGSAFVATVSQFVSLDLVQLLKVVSDNEQEAVERLTAKLLADLVRRNMTEIDAFIRQLIKLIPAMPDFKSTLASIDGIHCTVSQRQQYLDLISKIIVLSEFDERLEQAISEHDSMKDILKMLRNQLESITPTLAKQVSV